MILYLNGKGELKLIDSNSKGTCSKQTLGL